MKLNKKWCLVVRRGVWCVLVYGASRAKTYILRFTMAFGESKMKGATNGHLKR